MEQSQNLENEVYQNFLTIKDEFLGGNPGQFYPFRLENLFADECEKIALGLIYGKYNSEQGATMLIGVYRAYKELRTDLN